MKKKIKEKGLVEALDCLEALQEERGAYSFDEYAERNLFYDRILAILDCDCATGGEG